MIYCQNVGRLKHTRAVPPLKVGRLEPSHGDRFRRQSYYSTVTATPDTSDSSYQALQMTRR